MPIAINPICRKPRIHVKLNNTLRKNGNELPKIDMDAVNKLLAQVNEPNVLLIKEQKEQEKIMNLSVLNRINIRKSLPIFLNI